jgi:hypothetical protein
MSSIKLTPTHSVGTIELTPTDGDEKVVIKAPPSAVPVELLPIVKGDQGVAGPPGPEGLEGPSFNIDSVDIPSLTLLFENRLV